MASAKKVQKLTTKPTNKGLAVINVDDTDTVGLFDYLSKHRDFELIDLDTDSIVKSQDFYMIGDSMWNYYQGLVRYHDGTYESITLLKDYFDALRGDTYTPKYIPDSKFSEITDFKVKKGEQPSKFYDNEYKFEDGTKYLKLNDVMKKHGNSKYVYRGDDCHTLYDDFEIYRKSLN